MKGIYIWTNEVTLFQYVGKTRNIRSQTILRHTREKAVGLLAEDIRRYGLSRFSVKIHSFPNIDEKELSHKEREFILDLNTLAPNGYNKVLPNPESTKTKKRWQSKPPDYLHETGMYEGLRERSTRCQICNKKIKPIINSLGGKCTDYLDGCCSNKCLKVQNKKWEEDDRLDWENERREIYRLNNDY